MLTSLKPRRNRRHFADNIFKCIFLNENVWIALKISLEFVPKVRINNIPALVQIMAWRRPGDKPLSEPMMISLLTHICVTRPQWVNVIMCYNGTCLNPFTSGRCGRAGNLKRVVSKHTNYGSVHDHFSWMPQNTFDKKSLFLYPRTTKLLVGYIGFTPSVRLSVRPASCVRSVAPTVLIGSISYLYILSSNFRRYVACTDSCKISKFEFWAIF